MLVDALSGEDEDLRAWAAFGLGQMGVDSQAIRDALLEQLHDVAGAGAGAAGEAAVALAKRKDPRVLPVLREHLADLQAGNLWVEAAGELGDPCLLPELRVLAADGWAEDDGRGHLLPEMIDRLERQGGSGA